jgi:hypothetical protein
MEYGGGGDPAAVVNGLRAIRLVFVGILAEAETTK